MTFAEYGALVEDWRSEQRIEDLRGALAPWVLARVNGNRSAKIENFLILGGEKAKQENEQTPEGMAAVLKKWALAHNAELERQAKKNGRKARTDRGDEGGSR